MDYKKIKTDSLAVTRNISEFTKNTNNVYETVVVLSKRANQISAEIKEELIGKIEEFATHQDNLEEIFENREQIELARYYERMPKSTLLSTYEYLNDMIHIRNPLKEAGIDNF